MIKYGTVSEFVYVCISYGFFKKYGCYCINDDQLWCIV